LLLKNTIYTDTNDNMARIKSYKKVERLENKPENQNGVEAIEHW